MMKDSLSLNGTISNSLKKFLKNREMKFHPSSLEGIQGVGGIMIPTVEFLTKIKELCEKYNAVLILDEVQSGYGRSGYFFAHQEFGIEADIITTAKGMGNGFPIGGVLIHPKFQASYGLLGTTFGGNHLACVAAIAGFRRNER